MLVMVVRPDLVEEEMRSGFRRARGRVKALWSGFHGDDGSESFGFPIGVGVGDLARDCSWWLGLMGWFVCEVAEARFVVVYGGREVEMADLELLSGVEGVVKGSRNVFA
ncbi:hypothetical protein M0R45_036751 [Rubus argutus]|uniref:Uncharacterized protein n=1 Tax=Rubus argutus TaxID=59490 RepID=A0AAW1VZQ7_RUBAR